MEKALYAERPQLDNANITEMEKVDIIRDWAYERLVFAGTSNTYLEMNDERIIDDNIETYISNLFSLDELGIGGFYCDGAARSLAYLYGELGYEAVALDMAVFSGNEVLNSHVVTLVKIYDEWYVEDPTFNISYVNESGNAMPVRKMIELLGNKEDEKIVEKRGNTEKRPMLFENQGNSSYPIEFVKRLSTGMNLYLADMSIEHYNFDSAYGIFENDGFKSDRKYIFQYPYDIYYTNKSISEKDAVDLERMLGINNE